ncbi:MAG: hypothetical protein ACRD8U_14155 [Pyrinomonadaceae bacterium]
MNLIGTILLLTFGVLSIWQNHRQKQSTYSVTLAETTCLSTRRMRCSYQFVEASSLKQEKDKRHFKIHFYIGADQTIDKEDAISRLDRFFKIKREASSTPGVANTGTVGYKKLVTLRTRDSLYKFTREDGEKIVVDVEKMTRP